MSTDEHTIAIVSFEGAVKREVTRLRSKLKPAAEAGIITGNEFKFKIECSGRIVDGEMKLEYELSGVYGLHAVKGNSPNAVLDEFLRRQGWEKVNAPLQISASEDIPF